MSAIKISLNYCKGSYISLLDADDLFINDKIKNIHKLIKKYKKKKLYIIHITILKIENLFLTKDISKLENFSGQFFHLQVVLQLKKNY